MKQSLSFVIPVKDEDSSIEQLIKEINSVCKNIKNNDYEIIFIDDGSTDKSFQIIKALSNKDSRIKAFKLRGNFGKSIALSIGFKNSKGEIIFTLDGDLQDNPKEIPKFLKKLDEGYDLVSGWKKRRLDPISKTLPSKLFNFLASRLTKVNIHDFNCGFKAYRREVVNNINLYGELYRFIPALAAQKRFKVGEIVVEHRERLYGRSKYGWSRLIRGLLDLITVLFLTSYSTRPGHFFGTIGIIFFIPGFLIGLYITYLRIVTGGIAYRYPLLFLGTLLMIVGIQFIFTGLLAEIIISTKSKDDLREIVIEQL